MNVITYGLTYFFQKKSYESIKRYKERISEANSKVKRLTSENNSLREINELNEKRHRDDMLEIKFQLEEMNDRLTVMAKEREEDRKTLAHQTITVDSLYKLIDKFLEKYPEVKLSEIMQSVREDEFK